MINVCVNYHQYLHFLFLPVYLIFLYREIFHPPLLARLFSICAASTSNKETKLERGPTNKLSKYLTRVRVQNSSIHCSKSNQIIVG